MKKKPFVSVVVPVYHDWDRLQLCLNSLEIQTYPRSAFEIIVVNNDPSDKAPSLFHFPINSQLLEESKPGSYAARNKAISVAKGEIFAFTDSDCIAREDWLECAVNFLSSNPDYDRVGGRIILFSKNEDLNWSEIYEDFFSFPQERFVAKLGMAATANMIARRRAFDVNGLFNEELMSGGDGEWGVRARNKNLKIKFLDGCIVYHPTRDSLGDIVKKNRRVVGGHWDIVKEKSGWEIFKFIIRSFMPPINAMKIAIGRRDADFKDKIVAILLSLFVKSCMAGELIKLILKIKTSERV